jgi:hypothetical protein
MGLGLMAATTLAVAGCTDDATNPGAGSPASGTPSVSVSSGAADPAATSALSTAAAKLDDTSFKITMSAGPGLSLTGLMDAPNSVGTGTLELNGSNTTIQVKSLLVGQDLYVQVPGVTKADTWTHIDVDRLPQGVNLGLRPGQIDPANTARLLAATTDVQQVDSRSYRGSLDLTRVAGVAGIDKAAVDAWGDAARNVPFTAGLDDQGRLSAMTIQLPAVAGQQAQPLEILYTDYGTPVTAVKPAADKIIEAPESLYTTLSGSPRPSSTPS